MMQKTVETKKDYTVTGLSFLQSVQFAKVNGKRLAVISADDWEALVEWLETIEDIQIAKQAFAELKSFAGDRKRAGWLLWDEVKGDLV
jgi:hypothetical protein